MLSSPPSSLRPPLAEVTNCEKITDSSRAAPYCPLSPSSETSNYRGKKRQRLDHDEPSIPGINFSHSAATSATYIPTRSHLRDPHVSTHLALNKLASGITRSVRLSARPILQSLVSSNRSDLYRPQTSEEMRDLPHPFACAYSNAAKLGRGHALAVGTQYGTVDIIDASPRSNPWDPEPSRLTHHIHADAIFDLRWRSDDEQIVTSSGDHTSTIFNAQTGERLAILAEHKSSIKQTLWDPCNPSVLSSSSRDGDIHVYDIRETPTNEHQNGVAAHGAVLSIFQGHADSNKRKGKKAAVPRSVTSINYLKQRDNLLLSSGSADGVLKAWDLRATITKRNKPVPLYSSDDITLESSGRTRGIASVALDERGEWAWALATDGSIYTYPVLSLSTTPSDLPILSHPNLKSASFYVRLAFSPCGRYLASGSPNGEVYTWAVDDTPVPVPVELVGHERGKEVGAVDWGFDSLATASDDHTVRIWRPDPVVSRLVWEDSEEGKEAQWAWGFASENSTL
ncbi:hypothetical protein BOTBODRAFT_128924 [Botryobasidium botryosum FD-172 SS1]|uniref:Uncharacterized protein n=1 Tax=Botryobasidium botryosum (strain FD-172 SS1) TaxID=930990 RepID=A0A067N072_BOTB1|nr:hypothetical protein BOTBODRAFT_128924 [Botryobasidium botryosum FD-172 SS1]